MPAVAGVTPIATAPWPASAPNGDGYLPTAAPPANAIVPVSGGQVVSLPSVPGTENAVPASLPQAGFGPGVEVISGSMTPSVSLPTGEKLVTGNTIAIRFGASPNYQTVVGQVYQFRRTWRLRYAAVESEDKYGGSVILVGDDLDNLQDGQMVRVDGTILPTEDRSSSPRYHVNRIEVIDPSRAVANP